MHIKGITLHNYRLFEHKELEFTEQFTVLIGSNGHGKTSILDGLTVAIGSFLMGFDNVGQAKTIEVDDVRRVSYSIHSVELQVPAYIEAWSYVNVFQKTLTWKREVARISKKTTASFKEAKWLSTLASDLQKLVREGVEVDLPVFAYHGTGRLWAEHSKKPRYTESGSRIEQGYHACLSPKSSPFDFLSWYKTFDDEITKFQRQEDKDLLQAFNNAIALMVPAWSDIAFSHAENDLIGCFTNEDGIKEYTPYRLLSDGFRTMVGLTADIAYRCIKLNPHHGVNAAKVSNGIVLIDEIDLHLHPEWQKRIVSDLKLAFPNIQFIVTTHSPFIVQSLSNRELHDLSGKNMDSDYFRKSIEEIAVGEMGVSNVQRSEKFLEWQNAAEKYFELLEKNADNKELNEKKAQLDELEILYNEDPAWVALLKAERRSKELEK